MPNLIISCILQCNAVTQMKGKDQSLAPHRQNKRTIQGNSKLQINKDSKN